MTYVITRADIVAEARTWIKPITPWKHQARVKGVGVDCIGIIGMTALNCGVPGAKEWYEDRTLHCYGRSPKPDFLLSGCNRFMDRIPINTAAFADVLVMAFRRYPQHFALISNIAATKVIHAYSSIGCVTENGIDVANAKILYAYRFRGVV